MEIWEKWTKKKKEEEKKLLYAKRNIARDGVYSIYHLVSRSHMVDGTFTTQLIEEDGPHPPVKTKMLHALQSKW